MVISEISLTGISRAFSPRHPCSHPFAPGPFTFPPPLPFPPPPMWVKVLKYLKLSTGPGLAFFSRDAPTTPPPVIKAFLNVPSLVFTI